MVYDSRKTPTKREKIDITMLLSGTYCQNGKGCVAVEGELEAEKSHLRGQGTKSRSQHSPRRKLASCLDDVWRMPKGKDRKKVGQKIY